jgi:fibronectin-binding autotransporter adhesin
LQPFAGLAYVAVDRHGVTEHGSGGAALSGPVRGQGVLYTTLGTRLATTIEVAGRQLTPSLTMGWQHALGDTVPSASLAFAGSTAFGVAGIPVARDVALVGAGLSYDVSALSKIQVNYSGQVGPRSAQSSFTAQYSLRF